MTDEGPITFHIHAGYGKTGTSSIQRLFAKNADSLAAQGILYVGLLFERIERFDDRTFREDFQRLDVEGKRRWLVPRLEHAVKTCRERGLRSVLWSWEALLDQPESTRAALADVPDIEPEVIVYVRRQDDWFQSAYLQWGIRHKVYPGPVRSFYEWYPLWRPRGDYHRRITRWTEGIARSRVHVRPYERAQLPDGLHADVLSLLPLSDPSAISLAKADVYPTLSRDLLNVYRAYNDLFEEARHPGELQRFLDRALHPHERAGDTDRLAFLSPVERHAIIDDFADSNRRLATEFLGRDELFVEPYPAADARWAPLEDIGPQALARIMTQLVVHLDREVEALRGEVAELRRERD